MFGNFSASSIAAVDASLAHLSASSRARLCSSSQPLHNQAFFASKALSSASLLAFYSATFFQAALMASFLAASFPALANAS